MHAIKLRNKPAEQNFYQTLRLWRSACRDIKNYNETSLRFIWNQLESAWRRIGYEIGDEVVK